MLLTLLWACSGSGQDAQDPVDSGQVQACVLAPDRSEVSFGTPTLAALTEPVERSLTLRNRGDLACEVLASVEKGVFSVAAASDWGIAPGETLELTLRYAPTAGGEDRGSLLLRSNDLAALVQSVSLTGTALAPVLELSASDDFDFGDVPIGCSGQQTLVLYNTGTLDLEVERLSLEGTGTELRLREDPGGLNGPLPWTLGPGDSLGFWAQYFPVDRVSDARLLLVDSSDTLYENEAILRGTGTSADWTVERFEIPDSQAVDMLFAVDRSASLTDVLQGISDSFGGLIAGLERQGADYQVAAVAQNDGCMLGETAIIDSSMSATEQQAAWDAQMCLANDCGVAFTNAERAFTLVESALSSANTASGGCNAGFLRPDARLVLVGISDEPEQSPYPYTHYLSLFQALKVAPWDVVVSAIGGPSPSGCTGAMAYTGMYEAVVATGGQFHSICSADFDAAMDALGEGAVPTWDAFTLSETPVPESVEVHVDGVEQSVGWSYSSADNAVVFEAAYTPPLGSVVEVGYAQYVDCD